MDPATRAFLRFRDDGDLDALGQAFDLLAPRLLRIALHLNARPEVAEDLVQQTFVTALERAESFESGQPLSPWLVGILRNLGRSEGRRRRADTPLEDIEVAAAQRSPDLEAERRETLRLLRDQVDRLPEAQRQVVLLSLEHGLSPAEIAEVLGTSAGAVRMRLQRAREELRDQLPRQAMALAVFGVPTRGLEAVRETVLARGAELTAVTTAAGVFQAGLSLWSGLRPLLLALVMKKSLVAVGVAAVVALLLFTDAPWNGDAEPERPEPARPEQLSGEIGAAARVDEPVQRRAAEAPTVGEPGDRQGLRLLATRTAADGTIETWPLAGLPVRAWPGTHPYAPLDRSWSETKTDDDGYVVFEGLAEGTYQIDVFLYGFDQVWTVESLTAARDLVIEAVGVVQGRVVDRSGAVVPGASLWIERDTRGLDGMQTWELRGGLTHITVPRMAGFTDEKGWFRTPILTEEVRIGARIPGSASSASAVLWPRSQQIELQVGNTIEPLVGRVVDDTGGGVAGAAVYLDPTDGFRRTSEGLLIGPRCNQVTTSAADGSFRFESPPAGKCLLTAVHAGGSGLGWHRDLVWPPRVPSEVPAIETRPMGLLHGHLRWSDGAPVRSSRVRVTSSLESKGHYTDGRVREDGAYLARYLPIRALALVADAGLAESFSIDRPGRHQLDFTLPAKPSRSGRLRDTRGRPLDRWWVTALDASDQASSTPKSSGRDGSFRVFPQNDPHRLRIFPPFTDTLPTDARSFVTELRPEGSDYVVPDEFLPSHRLTGRIFDRAGQPFEGLARLRPRGAPKDRRGRTRACQAGEFVFDHLVTGTYELSIVGRDVPAREIHIGTEETTTAPEWIVETRPVLELRFVDALGHVFPSSPERIYVRDENDETIGRRLPNRDDGIIRHEVPPVRGQIEVSGTDLAAAPVPFDATSAPRLVVEIPVRVTNTRTLRFNWLEKDDDTAHKRPLRIVIKNSDTGEVIAELESERLRDIGGFHYQWAKTQLEAGAYRIEAERTGYRYEVDVQVGLEPDEVTTIDVPLRR